MDAQQLHTIKDRINRKIARTQSKIVDMEEMTKPISPENSIGRLSRLDAINNKSVMEAALRTARKELDDLQYAAKHVDDAEFGLCHKCKGEIQWKRLMLMPGSKYCVRCATK